MSNPLLPRLTTHENQYLERVHRFALLLLAAHLPVLTAIAWARDSGLSATVLLSLFFLAGPLVCYLQDRTGALTSISLGISTMCFSGLFIHVGGGMIELHFHVFVSLAALAALGSVWTLIIAAAVIAVHHVLFWFILPSSLFNYQASFGIVLLHAVFVILEVAPVTWIARQLRRAKRAEGITTEHLHTASGRLEAGSARVLEISQLVQRRAEEQADTLATTSASGQQITRIAQTTAQSTRTVSRLMGEVDTNADEARHAVEQMSLNMREIRDSSDRIATITRTINEIAFQTNILALNAAVEAARAGEAGLGFAVVAEEVRHLAQRCTDAAKNVGGLIEESVVRAKAGGAKLDEVTEAINQITDSTKRMKGLIEQVDRGGEEQARGVEQISHALASLEQTLRETAIGAASSAEASQQMTAEVSALQETVAMLQAS